MLLQHMDDCVEYKIIKLLAFWLSNQECSVHWHHSVSASFHIFIVALDIARGVHITPAPLTSFVLVIINL